VNKTCLACQIHPEAKCDKCKKLWCTECVLVNPQYWAEPVQICIGCYRKSPISKVATSKNMWTLIELHREARRVCPKGFVSVTADIQDHRPGAEKPHVEWGIYHEKLGHHTGKNQRKVYVDFCRSCDVPPKKLRKRGDII